MIMMMIVPLVMMALNVYKSYREPSRASLISREMGLKRIIRRRHLLKTSTLVI